MFTEILKDIANKNSTKIEEIKNEVTNSTTYFFPKYTNLLHDEVKDEVERFNSISAVNGNLKASFDSRSDLNYISVEVIPYS